MRLTPVRWTLQHGLPRAVMKVAARHGDPIPELVTRADADRGLIIQRIRAAGPIHRGRLVSATASHAAADRILRSADFGVGQEFAAYPRPLGELVLRSRDPKALRVAEPPSLVAVDNPDHARYRRLVARAFTPRAVATMRARIEETTQRLLDDMRGRLEVDLLPSFANRLPVTVISALLGIPERDGPLLTRFGLSTAASLAVAQPFGDYRRADAGVRSFNAWFVGHIARLRSDPGDDLLSGLVAEGELTERELLGIGGLMVNAGFVTTAAMLANAVDLLSTHPDQLDAVRADPALWPTVVDEVVRFDAPLRITARSAVRDTEVLGEPVRRGTRVVLLIDGANHDPAVFADPGRFDIHRPHRGSHLSFGGGMHYCLGAALARLEGEVGLSRLFERYPGIHTLPGPVRMRTPFLSVWQSLPVRLPARPARRCPRSQSAPRLGHRSSPARSDPAGSVNLIEPASGGADGPRDRVPPEGGACPCT